MRPFAGRAPVTGAVHEAEPALAVPLVELTIDQGLERSNLPQVGMQLDEVLALRPRHLVLDLSRCPALDAAGIGLLLDVHRRLWRMDGLLSLRSPTPRLRRVLAAARVANVLDILPEEPAGPVGDPAVGPPVADPSAAVGPSGTSAGPPPGPHAGPDAGADAGPQPPRGPAPGRHEP